MGALTHIDDDRGRFAGLAAILLALLAFVLLARNEDWKAGVDLLVTGIPAALVLAAAVAPPRRDGPPRGWVSAMLVAGFALSAVALISLADVLGANTDDLDSSTATWIAAVLAAGFAFIALRRDSAICTLFAAAAAVVAVLAAIDWIFSPDGVSTFRYVLLVEGVALFAAGVALYRRRGRHGHDDRYAGDDGRTGDDRHTGGGRHGVVLTVLAGIVIFSLIVTFAQDFITPFFGGDDEGGSGGIAWGWELVALATGLALAAFAAYTREPGPGYAAALLLLAFVTLAAAGDGFVGWPLVLLVLLAAAIAGAVLAPRGGGGAGGAHEARPTRPGPDEPHEVRL